jgi:hypothetical protein
MINLKPALVAREIVGTAATVMEDFKEGIISGEESMTDRLVQAIRTSLDGRRIGNLLWRARTLKTARGRGAEEKRNGADVLGVLEIRLPEHTIKKGFLWQAKIIEPDQHLPKPSWENFQSQCRTMLDRTDESFAAIYSRRKGVRFIPAQEIVEIDADEVYDLGSQSLYGFFKGHVKCEIGDRRLHSPTIEVLDALAKLPESERGDDARLMTMKASHD